MKKTKCNKHIGSSFGDFLKTKLTHEEFKREYEKARLNIAIGETVKRILKEQKLSIRKLAKEMKSSASQVQRLLDDQNISFDTLAKFAAATGTKIEINIK